MDNMMVHNTHAQQNDKHLHFLRRQIHGSSALKQRLHSSAIAQLHFLQCHTTAA